MRKGVIIAAGSGSRIGASRTGIPKPLVKVAGVPLIERVILTAKKGGLTHFVIVLGFMGEEIQRYLLSQKERLGVELEFAWNEEWEKPNGHSVLKAEPFVEDEFVLMMSDHLVEAAGLKRFLQNSVASGEILLACDSRIDQIFDLEDATRVLVRDGKIVEIGKRIERYNAVDTGFFLCSSAIFPALRDVCGRGEGSLTEGVRLLAACGKARALFLGNFFWQDVDSPETLVHAEKSLFALVAKAKPTDGLVSRVFNRKISGGISRFLVKTPVTPNQITYSALALGFLAAWLVSRGSYGSVAAGGVLFKFCSIYDGCDGEIAKLKLRSSRYGEWLDTVCDNVTYVAFFIGVLVGLYRQGASFFLLSLGALAIAGVLLSLGFMYGYLRRQGESGSLVTIQADLSRDLGGSRSFTSRLIRFLQPFAKRDFFALLFMVFALLNRLDWILIATLVGSQLIWIVLLNMRRGLEPVPKPIARPDGCVAPPQNPHVYPYTLRFRGPGAPCPQAAHDGFGTGS